MPTGRLAAVPVERHAAVVGRFAPSPTGQLHLGNLRTALLAWLFARSAGGRFLVRMEDLDRVTSSPEHERAQLRDLALLGLDWDGEIVHQSERFDAYNDAIERLTAMGLTYPCFCSRREIREASAAPNGTSPEGRYPGTCRHLTSEARARREASGRPAALRLRADGRQLSFTDRVHGDTSGVVNDIVLRRNDGVPAYNLAVVVDDAEQGINQVVRGDDLLPSTPSQVGLAELLGLPVPSFAHVPLILGPDGARLAKRHGAVTLSDLAAVGVTPDAVRALLASSVGLCAPTEHVTMDDLLERFNPASLPCDPSTYDFPQSAEGPRLTSTRQ